MILWLQRYETFRTFAAILRKKLQDLTLHRIDAALAGIERTAATDADSTCAHRAISHTITAQSSTTVSRKTGLGRPKKFAPCELGVRPARTGSSHGANWKSARCELFSVSETISGETRGGRHYAPLGHRAGTGPAPTPESRGRFRERREEAGIVPPWGIGLARGLPLHRSLRSKLRERSD